MKPLINHKLIRWARDRERLSEEAAARKLGVKLSRLREWEQGSAHPNFKQIQKIAQKFYVPLGYLFLPEPPQEQLPIPEFRTVANQELMRPSSALLAVLHDAQLKQAWLKEIREEEQAPAILTASDIDPVARIEQLLNIAQLRAQTKTYEDFLSELIAKLDSLGFIVIRNGVVGNNTRRPLDVDEFRGFALYDAHAPLIFINGKDFKGAQIFTLIHELAHLMLGESGLDRGFNPKLESKCDQIAADALVPSAEFSEVYRNLQSLQQSAKHFRVSIYVVLIKAKQLGLISNAQFLRYWQEEESRSRQATSASGGGNFYLNVRFRAGGDTFLQTVINYTLAGKTLYRDAYQLTGISGNTFDKYCRRLGVVT